ncbi:MAG: DUF1786 domain-containing protein [Candidatus Bathyarchaeota archaeon]|nr:MAG: DUF1786 domain-containing protein [Candidatus Bathyarchaeota archaeon]
MKILAVDIGAGTQDILLYDESKETIENNIKMVLPSPSQLFAEEVREATHLRESVFANGSTIGGGALASALKKHVKRGNRAIMTEAAAYTVRNRLDEVRELGIEIAKGEDKPSNFEGKALTLEEVELAKLQGFLTLFGETLSDAECVAVAVQDHGIPPEGMSNRRHRILTMKRLLQDNPKPESLAFAEDEIPPHFLRMKSAASACRKQLKEARILLMDTSPDAVLGCLKDPSAEKLDHILAINVGNGHTMAALVSDEKITAVVEHHTRFLTPEKTERLIVNFADGTLSDEEVFNDRGHGLFYLEKPGGLSNIQKIVATGPKRNLLARTKLPVHVATPAGDVMMTGPVGLIEAARRKFKLTSG